MILLTNGMKIGKATVVVDIIKKGNLKIRPGTIIKPRFITYHNTGNSGKGANAKAHNAYIHNLASYHPKDTSHVSWHISVDENFIYQHIPFDENAWHCGDGSSKASGNMTSIGIEICEHVDQKNYHQAEKNAIALGVYIAKALNIPIANHVPHQKWSGKYCPRVILKRDGNFTAFHNRIKAACSENNQKYRILTGTYATEHSANLAADKIKANKIASYVEVKKDGEFFRVQTGTYANKIDVDSASAKIKTLKIASFVNVLKA